MTTVVASILLVVVWNGFQYLAGVYVSGDSERTLFAVGLSGVFNLISVWVSPKKSIICGLRLVPWEAFALVFGLIAFVLLIPTHGTRSVFTAIAGTNIFVLQLIVVYKRRAIKNARNPQ